MPPRTATDHRLDYLCEQIEELDAASARAYDAGHHDLEAQLEARIDLLTAEYYSLLTTTQYDLSR